MKLFTSFISCLSSSSPPSLVNPPIPQAAMYHGTCTSTGPTDTRVCLPAIILCGSATPPEQRAPISTLKHQHTQPLPLSFMPPKLTQDASAEDSAQSPNQKESTFFKDLFSIPPPLKQLFDLVPLVTYPPNQLPQRSPKASKIPSLYIFSTERDAAAGQPSFNPSCLKWQVSSHQESKQIFPS